MTTDQLAQSLRRVYHAVPAPPSANYDLRRVGPNPYDLIPCNGIVLDLGAGGRRGDYSFVTDPHGTNRIRFIGLDLMPLPGVNVLGDAHAIPLKPNSVDCVVSVSTLEYLHQPHVVMDEAYRVLKPGGLLYLSAPFVFPYHPPPGDLYRFSFLGLRVLAGRFDEIRAGYNRGPASTFSEILVRFLAILFCFNQRWLYGLLLDLFKWGLFWIKYLDRWLGRYEVAPVLHGSAFFLGRKPLAGDASQGDSTGSAAPAPLGRRGSMDGARRVLISA